MPALANARYELFAQELAKGTKPEAAYVAAGFKQNPSNCIRLKNTPELDARVHELLTAGAAKAEITIARVMAELGKIGFSDIRKLFNGDGSLKHIDELDDDTAAAISSIEVVTKRIPGGERDEVERIAKIKLWDKRASLVDIGKHLGAFVEKVEHTGKDGGPIEIAQMTPVEQARRIAFALARGTQAN